MDDGASLFAMMDSMLWTTALVAAPILIAALGVGLMVGVIQAATSVNEQTLTFVPKLAIVAVVMVIFGASMFGLVTDFTLGIFEQIAGMANQ